VGRAFGGGDPSEPLALARLACEVALDDDEAEHLAAVRDLILVSEEALAEGGWPELPSSEQVAARFTPHARRVMIPVLGASVLAGTPTVPVAT
jgi:hypothetical protein